MTARTPGPWRYYPRRGEVYGRASNGGECVVAEVPREPPFEKQAHPDGRLIAAAPELEEVARLAAQLSWPRGHRAKLATAARAAIAKAEGR